MMGETLTNSHSKPTTRPRQVDIVLQAPTPWSRGSYFLLTNEEMKEQSMNSSPKITQLISDSPEVTCLPLHQMALKRNRQSPFHGLFQLPGANGSLVPSACLLFSRVCAAAFSSGSCVLHKEAGSREPPPLFEASPALASEFRITPPKAGFFPETR